jgi:hypothetical protein
MALCERMTTMRAVVLNERGPIKNLIVRELPIPAGAPNGVISHEWIVKDYNAITYIPPGVRLPAAGARRHGEEQGGRASRSSFSEWRVVPPTVVGELGHLRRKIAFTR